MIDFSKMAATYKSELLDNVVPFWLENSIDSKYGGFFTCLDRKGQVYDTDKFVWLQARQIWLFSMLYNKVENKQSWLDCAVKGAEFLKNHGHDGHYNWYFSLSQTGVPLTQPYNIFSYVFSAMAFAQLHLATGNDEYGHIALESYKKVIERQDNPKGIYNKAFPNSRNLKNFALPMILCNLSLEMEHLLGAEEVERSSVKIIDEIMNVFYRPELGLILENVNIDGRFSNTFEGRLINPGHGLEAMWFVMDLAERFNNSKLIEKSAAIALQIIDYGWDQTYGGIYYFMDVKGHPPQQLEWDQKLWWVHMETLITLLKAYRFTGSNIYSEKFQLVHDYTWNHFRDPEHGEWFGYLNRQGEVSLDLKGGKWKGCFHVPRGLFQCWQTLNILKQNHDVHAKKKNKGI